MIEMTKQVLTAKADELLRKSKAKVQECQSMRSQADDLETEAKHLAHIAADIQAIINGDGSLKCGEDEGAKLLRFSYELQKRAGDIQAELSAVDRELRARGIRV